MRRGAPPIPLIAALLISGCKNAPGTPTGQPSTPVTTTTTTTTLPAEAQGCGLPASRTDGCRYENSTFVPDVQRAIARVQREQPDLFDFTQAHDELSVLVRDVDRYHDEVVKVLRETGLCAIFDGEEVAVKNTNDFSDQYDIITSGGTIWHNYTATCRPAWSVIPPAGDASSQSGASPAGRRPAEQ